MEKAHHPLAFVGVEEDTHLGRWDDANGCRTSTGVTPHPVQLLDPPSSSMKSSAKSMQIHPATNHITQQLRHILEQKDQQQHHLSRKMRRRPWTLEQGIWQIPSYLASPLTPRADTKGARKRPEEFIPLRRRRHRLAGAARKTRPRRRRLPLANPSSTVNC